MYVYFISNITFLMFSMSYYGRFIVNLYIMTLSVCSSLFLWEIFYIFLQVYQLAGFKCFRFPKQSYPFFFEFYCGRNV